MTPLQVDPKQLSTIKKIMGYKRDLKENPGAAGENFFTLFGPTSSGLPNPELIAYRPAPKKQYRGPLQPSCLGNNKHRTARSNRGSSSQTTSSDWIAQKPASGGGEQLNPATCRPPPPSPTGGH